MAVPGASRERLVQTLNAAYAGGLISDQTLVERLDQVLHRPLVDPRPLVGDLRLRGRPGSLPGRIREHLAASRERFETLFAEASPPAMLLALDWHGNETHEIVIGRSAACDVVLSDITVSRRHARLFFRDGCWILQDLASKNGSRLNGKFVGRSRLLPGDHLVLGQARLRVD